MKVPAENICQVCKKYFCCPECCRNHERKNHAILAHRPILKNQNSTTHITDVDTTTIYLFCPICQEKPLLLAEDIYAEMLIHIEQNHLPLHCQKCLKMYTKIEDLKQFSKCIQPKVACFSENSTEKENLKSELVEAKAIHTTIATQTSPMRGHNDFNDTHITPISMINLRWKAMGKMTHEECISDSVSSIRNISSISNSSIKRSIGVASTAKGKLVRSTSTPLHSEMVFAKPKEQTFNASAGQVSSIYNSGCESESSLTAGNHMGTPSKQAMDVNRYRKVSGRPKMSAVTPLRQVMSKSIQKAFAEHGLSGVRAGFNRKKMFDSIDNSSTEQPSALTGGLMVASPLDLRLSPALRRTHTEPETFRTEKDATGSEVNLAKMRHEILLSSKKTTTESIVITRMQQLASVDSVSSNSDLSTNSVSTTKPNSMSCSTNRSENNGSSTGSTSSVYQSCRSVEIITSTELSAVNVNHNTYSTEESVEYIVPVVHPSAIPPITPTTRIKGAVIKKTLISFETPVVEVKTTTKHQKSPGDVFFTPNTTPKRKSRLRESDDPSVKRKTLVVPRKLSGRLSPSRRPSLRACAQSSTFCRIEDITEDYDDDEVFAPEKESTHHELEKPQGASSGRLWSLMTSVMRLPLLKGGQTGKKDESTLNDVGSKSIIKRCASIAGSIVRSKPLVDEEQLQSLKRKRTYTIDNQSSYSLSTNLADASSNGDFSMASSKRFRIHGRKPIERMRMNS